MQDFAPYVTKIMASGAEVVMTGDWGQDLKGLKRWMDARGVREINLSYFGTASPEYYGIANGGRIAGTQEIGIVSGTGRQDELEFQLLDPMADVRVGDALVTFGSKGGRPFAPSPTPRRSATASGALRSASRFARRLDHRTRVRR